MLEIVSGVDETTEVSVVGNDPDVAVPFAFTPGLDEAGGEVVVDETTEASSVAKCAAARAGGVNCSLLIFHLLLQLLHRFGQRLHLLTQTFDIRRRSRFRGVVLRARACERGGRYSNQNKFVH
ncbi:MAG: hypothetical protein DME41_02525 [Verrucomicrobia bacterium]|nr:MAG: hypothetical protein DME41_02525 [Verrucomicrobiota bacterium]